MTEGYTVTERKLTDEEIASFRKAMEDDGDPLDVFRGIRNALMITIATIFAISMIVTLIHLPGIP